MPNETNDNNTNRDLRPAQGQESNVNWDDTTEGRNENASSGNDGHVGARRIDEQTNTSGAGSSQRSKADNVGPLDADIPQLPSEKRRDRSNLTGSGID